MFYVTTATATTESPAYAGKPATAGKPNLFMPLDYAMQHRTFQRFMGSLFKHIIDTLEEHYNQHKQFVTILQENDQQINPAKCMFAASVVKSTLSSQHCALPATVASDWHVGGVLQQLSGGSWQSLAFYSK
jgi:hypothetical protein